MAETFAQPPEIVHGIIHKGSKVVMGGGSKTFKTWTLVDLAMAVAFGEPWLSFKTMKGKVLFCNFEIQQAFFQHRLKAVEKEKQINLKSGALDLWKRDRLFEGAAHPGQMVAVSSAPRRDGAHGPHLFPPRGRRLV